MISSFEFAQLTPGFFNVLSVPCAYCGLRKVVWMSKLTRLVGIACGNPTCTKRETHYLLITDVKMRFRRADSE